MKLVFFFCKWWRKEKNYLKFNRETIPDSCLFGKQARRESFVKWLGNFNETHKKQWSCTNIIGQISWCYNSKRVYKNYDWGVGSSFAVNYFFSSKLSTKKIAQKNDKNQILKPIPPATPVEKEKKMKKFHQTSLLWTASPLRNHLIKWRRMRRTNQLMTLLWANLCLPRHSHVPSVESTEIRS